VILVRRSIMRGGSESVQGDLGRGSPRHGDRSHPIADDWRALELSGTLCPLEGGRAWPRGSKCERMELAWPGAPGGSIVDHWC
jgi:hypothetical protein